MFKLRYGFDLGNFLPWFNNLIHALYTCLGST
jgi:hypothetical protein